MSLSLVPYLSLCLLGFFSLHPVEADTLVGTNGLSLTGEIISMMNGELTFKTQVGTHTLPMSEVRSFTIDRTSTAGSVPSATPQTAQLNDKQILSRLDSLATAIASLERQILKIQTTQDSQGKLIEQRTYDIYPQRNLKVTNTRVNHRPSGTIVTGQIVNGSSVPMSSVQAEVVLYGRTGKLRTNGGEMRLTVPVSPMVLEPGQTGTFSAQFESGLVVSNYEVFPKVFTMAGFNSVLRDQPNASQF